MTAASLFSTGSSAGRRIDATVTGRNDDDDDEAIAVVVEKGASIGETQIRFVG